jgi:hypothetical protein
MPWSRNACCGEITRARRGKAPACAAADSEAARSLCQGAEPRTIAIVYLDPSNPAIGVGIELDRDVVRIIGSGTLRHLDKAGGATNPERSGRCRYLMSPLWATSAATNATVPLAISNSAEFCLPPSS